MITKKDVAYVAKLARIELSEADKEKLTKDLAKILEYVNKLQQVDTSGVDFAHEAHPPLAGDSRYSDKPVNQLREDESVDSGIQEDILDLAPKRKGKYFEVKEVLE